MVVEDFTVGERLPYVRKLIRSAHIRLSILQELNPSQGAIYLFYH